MKNRGGLMAVLAMSGMAGIGTMRVNRVEEDDGERLDPDPMPRPDYSRKPPPAKTAGDLERIAAAQAKRDRKAAKRLVTGNTHGGK